MRSKSEELMLRIREYIEGYFERLFFCAHRSGDCRSHEDRGFLRAQIVSTQDQAKTAHQIAMQRICTAARKDVVVLAYRVATPRQRFRCKKAFSTK